MIFSSVMTCFFSALIKLNRKAEFSLFDDGLGSYSGNLIWSGGGTLYKIFSRITGTGAYATRPQKMYVNNKEMCKSKAADNILQIPKMEKSFLEIANRIFGVRNNQDIKKKVLFLSQPSNGLQTFADDMQQIIEVLKPYREDVVVRLHPRETEFEKYRDFDIDESKELWELRIAKMDMDSIVLVGAYSTAQITPKVIFDKEPWLLFTYHMSTAYRDEEKKSFDIVVNNVSDHYREKQKIMNPMNEDELKYYLEKILQEL